MKDYFEVSYLKKQKQKTVKFKIFKWLKKQKQENSKVHIFQMRVGGCWSEAFVKIIEKFYS